MVRPHTLEEEALWQRVILYARFVKELPALMGGDALRANIAVVSTKRYAVIALPLVVAF